MSDKKYGTLDRDAAVQSAIFLLLKSGYGFVLAVGGDEKTVVFNKTVSKEDFLYKILMLINTQNEQDDKKMKEFISRLGNVASKLTKEDLRTVGG